jgi:hypothetical protein
MTNREAGVFAAVFCAMGCLSAGALAYELNRPLAIPSQASGLPGLVRPGIAEGPTELHVAPVEPTITELPPVVIVSGPPAHGTTHREPRLTPRDCSGWRPLEQGSITQGVRLCD